uniref:Uncharacterized protein n=1 Tax=Arundo donax TaxID=35708 RepID=A0A0A8YF87_ARUDO
MDLAGARYTVHLFSQCFHFSLFVWCT